MRPLLLVVAALWALENLDPRVLDWPFVPFIANSNTELTIATETLTIVQFADLHLGEGPDDAKTLDLMRVIVLEEHPDFVVFTGDQVSGYAVTSEAAVMALWREALSVPAAAGIPFATLFGNHDDQLYKSDVLAWHYYANWGVAALLLGGALHKRLEPALVIMALFFLATKPTRAPRARLLQHELLHFPTLSYSQPEFGRLIVGGVALYFLDTGGGLSAYLLIAADSS